jgi:hypothetical protein
MYQNINKLLIPLVVTYRQWPAIVATFLLCQLSELLSLIFLVLRYCCIDSHAHHHKLDYALHDCGLEVERSAGCFFLVSL